MHQHVRLLAAAVVRAARYFDGAKQHDVHAVARLVNESFDLDGPACVEPVRRS
jgi:hypothetical protein